MALSRRASFRAFAFLFFVWLVRCPDSASAQPCPVENPNGPPKESSIVTTSGVIVYHNDLRQWFGFRLDTPVCGQKELQLVAASDKRWKEFEILRNCKAVIDGVLSIPMTGYYSTGMYQIAQTIHPASSCVHRAPFPDLSNAKPRPSLRRYRVKIAVSYRNKGSIHAEAYAGKELLTPWQAYASYSLTGGFVLWGHCHQGFSMSQVAGSPEANPSQTDDDALIDPESAAQKKVEPILMTFTCTREPHPAKKNATPK